VYAVFFFPFHHLWFLIVPMVFTPRTSECGNNQENTMNNKPAALGSLVGSLPAFGDISTISTSDFYGANMFFTPTSFHSSPLPTTSDSWATDTEKYEQHKKEDLLQPTKQVGGVEWSARFSATLKSEFSLYSSSPKRMPSSQKQIMQDSDQQSNGTIETTSLPPPRIDLPSYDQPRIPNYHFSTNVKHGGNIFPPASHMPANGGDDFSTYVVSRTPPNEVSSKEKSAAPAVTHVETPAGMTDEDFLTKKIIEFLEDREVNPYLGSLPSERVVNYARTKLTDQYLRVVGNSPGDWEQFVDRHQDKLTIFSADRNNKRIRLVKHSGYEIADDLMKSFRSEKEARVMACLACVLPYRHSSCSLNDFLDRCTDPTLGVHMEKKEMPPCGDLKRLILKHSKTFALTKIRTRSPAFEKSDFIITRISIQELILP
jgi:hypothetical protein